MITFERNKDPKESLDIGLKSAEQNFNTHLEAAQWFHYNIQILFPGLEFQTYGQKKHISPLHVVGMVKYIEAKFILHGMRYGRNKNGLLYWYTSRIMDYIEDIENKEVLPKLRVYPK